MIRSRVVLPEPDGPSSANSSPSPTFRLTLSSAAKSPNFFTMFLTSIVTDHLPFVQTPFEDRLHDQRDQRQHRKQRCDRERRHELVFVIEDFDQERHGVGLAADMA